MKEFLILRRGGTKSLSYDKLNKRPIWKDWNDNLQIYYSLLINCANLTHGAKPTIPLKGRANPEIAPLRSGSRREDY